MWGLPLPRGLFEERFGTPGNGVFGIPPRSTIGGGVPPIGRGGFGEESCKILQNPAKSCKILQNPAKSCRMVQFEGRLLADRILADWLMLDRMVFLPDAVLPDAVLPDGIPAGVGGMAFLLEWAG